MNPAAGTPPNTVTLILRGQTYEVKAGMTLRDSLLKIGVNPETVLTVREGMLLTDDEIVAPGSMIKLVMVISGG
jgi:sulfur carrier protein ThiS